ncbi:MAG: HAMP domain-containing histidine kinase [Sphingobacteriales bacterium JAD_PAG50586_3]|nr:MAG: HAMP domain-containing histidine kinase [Sphingobacteriales bacterium JAD_PAG50586_3]
MKQKLLHKTLKLYIIFSVLVLLFTAPIFYFIADEIQLEEADEALLLRQHEFESILLPGFKQTDIAKWNGWNRDIKIEPANTLIKTSQFSTGNYLNIMDGDFEPYRVLKSPVIIDGAPYILFIKINLLKAEHMVYNIVMLYVAIIFFLLIGLFIISRWYLAKLWQPFQQLLLQLEHFEINNPVNIAYSSTNVDEFYRLNTVIGKLISRNIIIYNNQKEFVENAAHELQTPLAVMQAKLDNLIQADDISPALANGLTQLSNSITRLNHINKNLLLLSRIGNDTYIEQQEVDLAKVLNQQLAFVQEQIDAENITITSHLANAPLKANIALVEVCTGNLLTNAIKHNYNGGTIHVELIGNLLTVTNTGTTTELDSEKLFTRFTKINPASHGAGLGLAIVRKITGLYGWNLQYQYQNNLHVFSIRF